MLPESYPVQILVMTLAILGVTGHPLSEKESQAMNGLPAWQSLIFKGGWPASLSKFDCSTHAQTRSLAAWKSFAKKVEMHMVYFAANPIFLRMYTNF